MSTSVPLRLSAVQDVRRTSSDSDRYRDRRRLGGSEGNGDREHAAEAGPILDGDVAAVRAHGLSRNRETQPEAGAVRAAPVGKCLKQITRTCRNAATLVFDLDEEPRPFRVDT